MTLSILILAAGKSKRMQSATPKVLHAIAGKKMIHYAIDAAKSLQPTQIAAVIGTDMAELTSAIAPIPAVIQNPPRGTGHAVQCATDFLSGANGTVLVIYGDTPFLQTATLQKLVAKIASGFAVGVIGFYPEQPGSYGRLVTTPDGKLQAIVEARDCTAEQKFISYCNAGIMAFDAKRVLPLLAQLQPHNAQSELYLTDLVSLAVAAGMNCTTIEAEAAEVIGINSREELAKAEAVAQTALRRKMMDAGVTLLDPHSVYLSHDTKIGADSTIEPHVFFGPGVTVGAGSVIKAFSHLDGVTIGDHCRIGPFARLRPGSDLADHVHIGNFVELKNARLESGVKAGHLSYLGDVTIGSDTNIGAGTITCNYDGFNKHQTTIGAGVFIGSNTALVAPVALGDGAMIGAGSVITADVPADALGISRSAQENKPGWAMRFREFFSKRNRKIVG